VLLSYELRMGVLLRPTTKMDSALHLKAFLPIEMGSLCRSMRMGFLGLVMIEQYGELEYSVILPLALCSEIVFISQVIVTTCSSLGWAYGGNDVSDVSPYALFGQEFFRVSDYEVFKIDIE
jgi:hypothetical protein